MLSEHRGGRAEFSQRKWRGFIELVMGVYEFNKYLLNFYCSLGFGLGATSISLNLLIHA